MENPSPAIAPDEIRNIRERLGLTQVEAGELIGGGPRAFTKYRVGDREAHRRCCQSCCGFWRQIQTLYPVSEETSLGRA